MPTKPELTRLVKDQNELIAQQNQQIADQAAQLEQQQEILAQVRAQIQQLQQQNDLIRQQQEQQRPPNPVVHIQDGGHVGENMHHVQHAGVQPEAPPVPPLRTPPGVQPNLDPNFQNISQLLPQLNPNQHININYYANQQNRRICNNFKGNEVHVTPIAWISFFESRTRNLADVDRFNLLADYLVDEAQDWYLRQNTNLGEQLPWNVVRQNFIDFFSSSVSSPAVAASHLKFKVGESLKDYYQQKCRYFDLANIQLRDRISFLTDGIIDDSVREGMIIASIDSLSQWYTKAKDLVENFERKKARLNRQNNFKPGTFPKTGSTRNQDGSGNKPFCKICKERNITARHWHSECPNKNKSTSQPAQKIVQNVQVDQENDTSTAATSTPSSPTGSLN